MKIATDKTLAECLDLVRRVFDPNEIAGREIDVNAIAEYYRQSDRGYRLFHSAQGALHLALNHGSEFEFAGYAGQAEFVERHTRELQAKNVLEAGSGNGFNCICLGQRNPECEFVGVDLTEQHVTFANKSAAKLPNTQFEVGNYETLPYANGQFDAVFSVESLCQTPRREVAFEEMYRVLRPGGRLLVVDSFRNLPLEEFSEDLQLAAKLVEKTTATNEFAVVDEFSEMAIKSGFSELERTDLRDAVAHNLDRLYGLARRFFNMRAGMWAMKKTFGDLMLQNSICGLLMPFTVGSGVHGYYSLTFEKS